jgi:membrane-bound ClpP family serine protease
VNEGLTAKLQVAQRGVAISSLRPIGKAEFEGKTYEVKTFGDYIDSGTKIEIIKIEQNNIYVQTIT